MLFQNLLQYKILQNAPIREKFTSQQSRNLNVIKRKGEREWKTRSWKRILEEAVKCQQKK